MIKKYAVKTKRMLLTIVAASLLFSLTACTQKDSTKDNTAPTMESSSQDSITSEQTEEPQEEETTEPATDSISENAPLRKNVTEIYDNQQYLKDIDWEEFQTRINDDEAQALQKYLPVLKGEEFVWIYRSGEGEEPDTFTHAQR